MSGALDLTFLLGTATIEKRSSFFILCTFTATLGASVTSATRNRKSTLEFRLVVSLQFGFQPMNFECFGIDDVEFS